MRADAHYVEQLTSRRDRALSDVARALDDNTTTESFDRLELRMRRAEKVMTQISEGIATIESAAAMLATPASALARRTGLDLIRAEAWRACWLIRANALVDGGHRGQFRPRPAGSLLTSVRDAFAAECRRASIDLEVDVTDWNTTMVVDETAMLTGIGGAIVGLVGLMGEAEGSTIRLTAATVAGELRAIEVSQASTTVPPGAAAAFFDLSSTDRPGGWPAAIGAAAAKAAARLHGGDAVFLTGDRSGCTVRLRLGRST